MIAIRDRGLGTPPVPVWLSSARNIPVHSTRRPARIAGCLNGFRGGQRRKLLDRINRLT
jgi:hypothetical protein